MCGICGYITRQVLDSCCIETMTDTLDHRGPDDRGTWLRDYPGYQVACGHRRLSILDTSARGRQPMHSVDGNTVLTYNGEIYNYAAIRDELEARGHRFSSSSDTEVLLNAWCEWGVKCVPRLNGMFAFAIWDHAATTLYLVRDRIGIKPLYYRLDGADVSYGSELKAVLSFPGFSGAIDPDVLVQYLTSGYIAAPRTIFHGVRKLPQGHYLAYNARTGAGTIHRYWQIDDYYRQSDASTPGFAGACDELEVLLRDAVRSRLVSDVPIGAFLSGGIDSSLIVALMQQESGESIRTFTIGFSGKGIDEGGFAKAVAAHLGTRHTEHYCTTGDALQLVSEMAHYFDEPFADPSAMPTLLLSQLARRQVTVCLSGDGGDEQFCGYESYRNDLVYEKCMWLSRAFQTMSGTGRGPASVALRKFLSLGSRAEILHQYHNKLVPFVRSILLEPPENDVASPHAYRDDLDLLQNHMLMDLKSFMVDDILTKVDRASMAASLEVRVPLLDHRVVEYTCGLPMAFKRRGRLTKVMLRELLYRYVPRDLLDRPKMGFTVPLADWLNDTLAADVERVCGRDAVLAQGLFATEAVENLRMRVRKRSRWFIPVLWNLYTFQLWYERYSGSLK